VEPITLIVVKMDAGHRTILSYPAELVERRPDGIVLATAWELPARDLSCVRFELGDRFTERYYTDRWFDVQEVAGADGRRKGWYCDVAEPAVIEQERVSLVDLDLDVWVSAAGEVVVLDEDEFAASPLLSAAQRVGARRGLEALLRLVAERQEVFAALRSDLSDQSRSEPNSEP
jgi:predicted RNA-binding protein associated with RNAse of E/G family